MRKMAIVLDMYKKPDLIPEMMSVCCRYPDLSIIHSRRCWSEPVGLPSTDYAAHTIMNHATDYGNIRYEMGYASAICFVLFAAMLLANKGINWLLGKYLD